MKKPQRIKQPQYEQMTIENMGTSDIPMISYRGKIFFAEDDLSLAQYYCEMLREAINLDNKELVYKRLDMLEQQIQEALFALRH